MMCQDPFSTSTPQVKAQQDADVVGQAKLKGPGSLLGWPWLPAADSAASKEGAGGGMAGEGVWTWIFLLT